MRVRNVCLVLVCCATAAQAVPKEKLLVREDGGRKVVNVAADGSISDCRGNKVTKSPNDTLQETTQTCKPSKVLPVITGNVDKESAERTSTRGLNSKSPVDSVDNAAADKSNDNRPN